MRTNTLMTTALAAAIVTLPTLVMSQTQPAPAQPRATPPAATTPAPAPPMPQTTQPVTPMRVASTEPRRASSIIGANIYNEENRSVGEVHDLLVTQSGGAITAVLSVGGFLGIGERYVTVPLSDLQWNIERSRWTLPGATVESLKARPAFTYPQRG
ncbi:PRC-barrel domain-containing protein [Neoroseomonas soli]|uniref:PRC-barrel domain containing protein n=1 Tax=Neoroseomonas soli TaxID=1081025 RepID=A0A9X9WXD6_9PROT|nr:PRC-barrel domain-containing protein [Neoroseomonas soli]MBR0671815.1 PRC-barrel domain containing protein [Neoroseomonas soli]